MEFQGICYFTFMPISPSLFLSLSPLGHMCWYANLLDCTAAACVDCVFYANMLGEVLK